MTAAERVVAVEHAGPSELAELPVDDVLAALDRLPDGYRDLYYRWEAEQWGAGTLDFGEDRRQWTELASPVRDAVSRWIVPFYVAGEQVTNALVRFVDAARTEEQGVFLTTQLVDDARHSVFYDRFFAEVLDRSEADMERRVTRRAHDLDPHLRELFFEALPAAADRIGADRGNREALTEGVVLHHLLLEGTFALTVQRGILTYLQDGNVLPGLRGGLSAVVRDETRHVSFAMRYLRETVTDDERSRAVVAAAVGRYVPLILAPLDPARAPEASQGTSAFSIEDAHSFATKALVRRLRSIGVDVDL
ncbi:MAG: ribonucleotide-diphosphate reductase subunit beta [Actinomycetota bacterium]|nr:ribonucleotide-diphosphate reductase subunit beta [Actinomycetota bacterium]